ncbi:hypothetical protein [uncultured Aquimarina sp.]|uniref:hypothetical protein n=1 Tax=uncultured Aquimarina sp. TaxID=575652 RepID=UPI00261EC53B|nr:hypothetical protein [uncultured Aquimarina sp.]
MKAAPAYVLLLSILLTGTAFSQQSITKNLKVPPDILKTTTTEQVITKETKKNTNTKIEIKKTPNNSKVNITQTNTKTSKNKVNEVPRTTLDFF